MIFLGEEWIFRRCIFSSVSLIRDPTIVEDKIHYRNSVLNDMALHRVSFTCTYQMAVVATTPQVI